jgi:Circadian oscillating protein COP23
MNKINTKQILSTWIVAIGAIVIPQFAQAQLPTIVDKTEPASALMQTPSKPEPSTETPNKPPTSPEKLKNNNTPQATETPDNSTTTAAVEKLKVSCQDLKTVVQKGDRQAVMMTWNSSYFGREFSNSKRCQVVSDRLQKAADANGGTLQGLQLASGTVNFQTVICALQNNSKKCDLDNLLFTLKPENAGNPEAVIQQMLTFAEEGSGSVNESSRSKPKVDMNLGNWERKAFGKSKSPAKSPAKKIKNTKTGF